MKKAVSLHHYYAAAATDLGDVLAAIAAGPVSAVLSCQYVEVYNETLTDLFTGEPVQLYPRSCALAFRKDDEVMQVPKAKRERTVGGSVRRIKAPSRSRAAKRTDAYENEDGALCRIQ